MTTKKLTWIMPNVSWFGKRAWHNALPYTEGLLIAILKQNGYEVNVIDANIRSLNEKQLEEEIRNVNPEIVLISALSMEYRLCVHKSFDIVKKVNPDIITIIGGIYPTLSSEIVEKDFNIDYMVLGDGELRLLELLKVIEKNEGFEKLDGLGIIKNGERIINPPVEPGILDLDSLPLPDYSEFDVQEYMNGCGEKYTQNFNFEKYPVGLIMTSRGCPYSCGYCASRIINTISGKRFRVRSPENIMKEIDLLVNKYGMNELLFIDDNFLIPQDRAIKLMDMIHEKYPHLVWSSNNLDIRHINPEILAKMKESGCYQLTFSIESGCPATFKRMNRVCDLNQVVTALENSKKAGFDEVISNFVIGYPGDTWNDIMETINFAYEMKMKGLLDYVLFSIATPLPKTDLYEISKNKGFLPKNFNFENPDFYGFGGGFIETPEFKAKELQILRAFSWDLINFRTQKDREKVAKMTGITLEELEEWRKQTREKFGIRVDIADKN